MFPAAFGVNVILPSLPIDAVATSPFELAIVGFAPLEQLDVNILSVPYVPSTIVFVLFSNVVLPFFTVVVLLDFAPV